MDKHGIDVSVIRCSSRFLDRSHTPTMKAVFLIPLVLSFLTQFGESMVGFLAGAGGEQIGPGTKRGP